MEVSTGESSSIGGMTMELDDINEALRTLRKWCRSQDRGDLASAADNALIAIETLSAEVVIRDTTILQQAAKISALESDLEDAYWEFLETQDRADRVQAEEMP